MITRLATWSWSRADIFARASVEMTTLSLEDLAATDCCRSALKEPRTWANEAVGARETWLCMLLMLDRVDTGDSFLRSLG